jgi:F0F1-type ATP synthase assembly protein I
MPKKFSDYLVLAIQVGIVLLILSGLPKAFEKEPELMIGLLVCGAILGAFILGMKANKPR